MAEITVVDMVRSYLHEHGYDGLYWDDGDDGCGCGLDDFVPCGHLGDECVAARKHPTGGFVPINNRGGTP